MHWYTVADTQVTMLQADGLCKEYARIKFNDDIECSNKSRPGTVNPKNDYIKCTSKLTPTYYEFKFDDVVESIDSKIQNGVMESLCKIYGLKFQKSIGTTDAAGNVNLTIPYCETKDSNICKKISESGKRFNYYSEIRTGNFYGSGYCGFYQTNNIYSQRDLQTAYGIPNDVFYSGEIQMQGSTDLKDAIKRYVTNAIKPEQLTKFECNDNTIQIGSLRGQSDTDDVLTCYANGKRIDFVFDDLSEGFDYISDASKSGLDCIINNGRYEGRMCRGLDEKECLEADSKVSGGTRWDIKAQACVLKDASKAQSINNGIMIATGIVITVGTVVTVGAPVLVALVVVSVGIDGAFIGLERLQEIKPHHRALQFMEDASKCDNATCAYTIVKNHFARLSEILDDLNSDELEAVANEFDRVSGLLTDEQFVEALSNSGLLVEDKVLDGADIALIAVALFVVPEKQVVTLMKKATKFVSKLTKYVNKLKIEKVLKQFGKETMLHGSLNGYRVFIDNGDNYIDIISQVQKNGWYVAADIQEGKRVLLITQDDISHLLKSRTDWLLNNNLLPVFDKVYDSMPDDVIVAKLDYVYRNSGTKEQAINALLKVGVFDEVRARQLADDLANEVLVRLKSRPDLVEHALNWKNLNEAQRKQVHEGFHQIITTLRRKRAGNTVLNYGTVEKLDCYGSYCDPIGNLPRQFKYAIDRENFVDVLTTIFHENTHAFQSLGKTSIPEPFLNWADRNYVREGNAYWDNIMEIEARYIGEKAAGRVYNRM